MRHIEIKVDPITSHIKVCEKSPLAEHWLGEMDVELADGFDVGLTLAMHAEFNLPTSRAPGHWPLDRLDAISWAWPCR